MPLVLEFGLKSCDIWQAFCFYTLYLIIIFLQIIYFIIIFALFNVRNCFPIFKYMNNENFINVYFPYTYRVIYNYFSSISMLPLLCFFPLIL